MVPSIRRFVPDPGYRTGTEAGGSCRAPVATLPGAGRATRGRRG